MLVKSAENPSAGKADPSNVVLLLSPAFGLIIPLSLALAWEIAVWLGISSGRLMPPPSRIYTELVELAQKGDLQTHSGVTLLRVVAGFFIGVWWNLAGCDIRLLDSTAKTDRSFTARLARCSFDCMDLLFFRSDL